MTAAHGELERLIDELPPERAELVFTHPNWAPDRASSYERLEFLGDSVLELAVAAALYDRYPDRSEGQLTKIRAQAVSRVACAVVARELDLGRRLRERGEELKGDEAASLSRNQRILAAVLEAALGALVLEHGFDRIRDAVVAAFDGRLEHALVSPLDHKTALQEALGRDGRRASYSVLEVDGPPHERTFHCAVSIDGEQAGTGTARSKKEAEQEAAREALEKLVP
ncbi:MAG: ribonuclease III [Gaiellaceae bacterium]